MSNQISRLTHPPGLNLALVRSMLHTQGTNCYQLLASTVIKMSTPPYPPPRAQYTEVTSLELKSTLAAKRPKKVSHLSLKAARIFFYGIFEDTPLFLIFFFSWGKLILKLVYLKFESCNVIFGQPFSVLKMAPRIQDLRSLNLQTNKISICESKQMETEC